MKRISRSTFKPLIALKTLNIADNRLRGIHNKLFSSLENLVELDISYNYIKDMGKDTFYGTRSLKPNVRSDCYSRF